VGGVGLSGDGKKIVRASDWLLKEFGLTYSWAGNKKNGKIP